MRRLQIYIDEELDEALAAEALRSKTSKAALIRRYVAQNLGSPDDDRDALDSLVGRYDGSAGSIDETVYGA